jgi:phage terminase small subunit
MGKTKETLLGLPTKKEQLFCRKLLEYKYDSARAVRAAYKVNSDKSAISIAAQNLNKQRVKDYIAKLEAKNIEKSDITIEELITEAVFIVRDRTLRPQERLSAIELTAKLTGHFIERRENKNFDESRKVTKGELAKLSKDELMDTMLELFKVSAQGVGVERKEEKTGDNMPIDAGDGGAHG